MRGLLAVGRRRGLLTGLLVVRRVSRRILIATPWGISSGRVSGARTHLSRRRHIRRAFRLVGFDALGRRRARFWLAWSRRLGQALRLRLRWALPTLGLGLVGCF